MGRERLHPALVWICDTGGSPHGAGVLVAAGQVLTCAHVVVAALGQTSPSAPADPVTVRFTHVGDDAPRRAAVRAGRWFPPGSGGEADAGAGDLALLDLLEGAPPGAQPVPTFVAGAGPGEEIHAFGLPLGHDVQSGGWASGLLAGPQASGWIQIDSPAEGYRIQPGFSGAAAWSDAHDAVVGTLVAAEASPDTRVAWMIPAAFVGERCPEVAVEPPKAAAPALPGIPRIVKVTNAPPPPMVDMTDESGQVAFGQWLDAWFNTSKIVVNVGASDGVSAGDYFDVLAKHEAVEDDAGKVIGFVDESGSLIRAAEVQERLTVCQLESFAYQSFFNHVQPLRIARLGLDDDAEVTADVYAELMAPIATGDVVKVIPSAEKDARDEVEDLYGRSLDDDLSEDDKLDIYRDMIRRADRFLARFPGGYFAGPVLYHKGYALFESGQYRDALDTFELYRRQYPFGSTEGAEHYMDEARTALKGNPTGG
jgi:hypothetical protein